MEGAQGYSTAARIKLDSVSQRLYLVRRGTQHTFYKGTCGSTYTLFSLLSSDPRSYLLQHSGPIFGGSGMLESSEYSPQLACGIIGNRGTCLPGQVLDEQGVGLCVVTILGQIPGTRYDHLRLQIQFSAWLKVKGYRVQGTDSVIYMQHVSCWAVPLLKCQIRSHYHRV